MSKVSNRGVVTIPAVIRHALNLQPGTRLRFTSLGGSKVLLQPMPRERSPGVPGDVSQLSDES